MVFPIEDPNTIIGILRRRPIKEIIDAVAGGLGFFVAYERMSRAGSAVGTGRGKYQGIIIVNKSDSPKEKYLTIVHEFLHLAYPKGNWRVDEQSYERVIEEESKRLVKENPDLPTYILLRANKIEGADTLDEFFQIF